MEKKRQILKFITREVQRRGLPPTIREIGMRFNISSTNGVRYFLDLLQEEGLIRRESRTARGIRIVQRPPSGVWTGSSDFRASRSERNAQNGIRLIPSTWPLRTAIGVEHNAEVGTKLIPVLGRVSAGKPLFSEENVEDKILVDERIAKGEGVFAVRVFGDSMVGAGINEGDLAVVRKTPDPVNGDIVVALIDDEVTLKRFLKKGKVILLKPENARYSDINLSQMRDREISIIGTVIAIVRKY